MFGLGPTELVVLLVWVACGYACYILARNSGRDTTLAIVLGVLFGIFAVIGYLIVTSISPKTAYPASYNIQPLGLDGQQPMYQQPAVAYCQYCNSPLDTARGFCTSCGIRQPPIATDSGQDTAVKDLVETQPSANAAFELASQLETTPSVSGTIRSDLFLDGKTAFNTGEIVTVGCVDPNLSNPDYKYIVVSQRLGKPFRLSDRELEID